MRTALAVTLAAFALPCSAASLLASLFQDHMVLQRERPVLVWGQAAPGSTLSVQFGGHTANGTALDDGRWQVTLPALPAGGPHRLAVRASDGAEQLVEDVLVGDVWLCSGQSNMALQVGRALDSWAEIGAATDGAIRMLTVANEVSPVPLREFRRPAQWQVTSPSTVGEFSALCYFLARELRKTVKVPMGLVNASWGGSAISSWLSAPALHELGGQDEMLAILADYHADEVQGNVRWGARWQEWWRQRSGEAPGREVWQTASNAGWARIPRFGPWESWEVPSLEAFNGMLWFRSAFTLSAAQASQSATLLLGGIEDVDQTFVNGQPVGNSSAYGRPRAYQLPAGVLRAGRNEVLVNVLDTYGTGGMHGPADAYGLKLADGTQVGIDEDWLYRVVDLRIGYPPRAPWDPTGGLTMIGNAMIAPLGRFAFRGVAWYQGESDVGKADLYAARLGALFKDWRGRFGADLPFLVVQLAAYGSPATLPVESATAELREAQRLAVDADPHAALAVAVDLGERTDIHPANKQDVARRLARAARHLVYGEAIYPSGPRPTRATREGEHVRVQFGDVTGSLHTYSADRPIGFELCAPQAESCRYADGRVDGSSVLLEVEGLAADEVRFCWADSPVCNLYDSAGLPAVPFELAVTWAPGAT